jgi:hypothetical protein
VTSGDVGTLNYELGPIAASDKIAVGGTLNIGTAALDLNDFVFTNLGGLQNGTYPLIETNSVITGTLGGVTNGTLGSATIVLQKSADNTDIELVVSGLGGGTAYQTWATGNEPFDGDANGDGVKDGLAFLLGAVNPSENAIGRLPTVSQVGGNLILNFNCLPIAARGTATLKVAHSTNLGSWTTTTDVVPDADDAVPDNNVTFVVGAGPVGPPALKSVTATIGSAAAAGGKLFGRLEANQP